MLAARLILRSRLSLIQVSRNQLGSRNAFALGSQARNFAKDAEDDEEEDVFTVQQFPQDEYFHGCPVDETDEEEDFLAKWDLEADQLREDMFSVDEADMFWEDLDNDGDKDIVDPWGRTLIADREVNSEFPPELQAAHAEYMMTRNDINDDYEDLGEKMGKLKFPAEDVYVPHQSTSRSRDFEEESGVEEKDEGPKIQKLANKFKPAPPVYRVKSASEKIELPAEYENTDFNALERGLVNTDYQFFRPAFTVIKKPTQKTDQLSKEHKEFLEQRKLEADRATAKFMNAVRFITIVDQGSHSRVTNQGRIPWSSCVVLGGNRRGWAGWGRGRGQEPETAYLNAVRNMQKNMIYVPRYEGRTLYQSVTGKKNGTKVMMNSCRRGFGMTAGPLMYEICEAFGFVDISTKIIGKNKSHLNTLNAVWEALRQQVSTRELAVSRGKHMYYMAEEGVTLPDAPTYAEMNAKKAQVTNFMKQTDSKLKAHEWMNLNNQRLGKGVEPTLPDLIPSVPEPLMTGARRRG